MDFIQIAISARLAQGDLVAADKALEAWHYREFRVGRRFEHQAAMARVKRSPKRTANCALAMIHSRGLIFHSFSDRFKTRKRSFMAASSLENYPRARSASIAFVVSGARWFSSRIDTLDVSRQNISIAGRSFNARFRAQLLGIAADISSIP
jgi:acyl-CoA reductase-like NAD-dependent aldehyde dehydrogenase